MKQKKGALTQQQLISIILLVVGFSIVLFAFPKILFSGTIDREVCHESVILRATAGEIGKIGPLDIGRDVVPLKCKTRDICLTNKFFGKGECNEQFGSKKYDTIRIRGDEKDQETLVKQTIAREMADCWAMMGQGKIQVFAKELLGLPSTSSKGVICSKFAFDNTIKEELNEVSGLEEYLFTRKAPNTDGSYVDYLTNRVTSKGFEDEYGDIKVENIDTSKVYSTIFIEANPNWGGATTGVVIGTIIAVGTGGVGIIAGGIIAGAGGLLGYGLQDILGESKYSGVLLREYSVEDLRELNVDSFESIS